MTAFHHEALLYAGAATFCAATVPFIRAGLEAEEPILVVVARQKIEALREELGADQMGVQFADMAEVGGNPARILPLWRRFSEEHAAGGRSLRGIGEPVWAGRSAPELVECQRHESLLNLAFADSGPFALLCPYDVDTLPDAVIEAANRSHPFIGQGKRRLRSATYAGVADASAPFDVPLPEAPPWAPWQRYDTSTLHALRSDVAGFAAGAGVSWARTEDLVTSVSEVATNSIRHGGGNGTMGRWVEDDAVICELRDGGQMNAPLAGREMPPLDEYGGRGLWVANQLCDLVQIRSFPEGTVVRLHMRGSSEPSSRSLP